MFQYGSFRSVEERKKQLIQKQRVLQDLLKGAGSDDKQQKRLQAELDGVCFDLEQLRLRGDEIWIVHHGKKKLLEITPNSQLVFALVYYTHSPEIPPDLSNHTNIRISVVTDSVRPEGADIGDGDSGIMFEIRTAERVRDIWEIKTFRRLNFQHEPGTPATGSYSSSPSAASAAATSAATTLATVKTAMTETPQQAVSSLLPRSYELVWRDGSREVVVSQDFAELEAMIECHLRRFRAQYKERVESLKIRCADAFCPFDAHNPQHEELLLDLWSAIRPDEPLEERVSSQWKSIGFQGSNPATDFRGMGVLGLRNLHYFARNYTAKVREIVAADREYPWAVTGINITHLLFSMLKISPSVDLNGPLASFWSDLLLFFCATGSELAFEETYVQFFLLFDATWLAASARYMDFPYILALVKSKFEAILAKRLHSLPELENQVQQEILFCQETPPSAYNLFSRTLTPVACDPSSQPVPSSPAPPSAPAPPPPSPSPAVVVIPSTAHSDSDDSSSDDEPLPQTSALTSEMLEYLVEGS